MPLTITDFFEQVDGLSTEDAPPELRARIDEELAELTDGFTGPQGEPSTGSSPGDPDALVVDQDGAGDFETIQAALDDPDTDPGDTILIRAGRYAPTDPIDVTDPGELRLIGAGRGSAPKTNTVIEQAIDVTVNDAAGNGVTLRNLRLSNAGPFDAGGDGADLDAVFNASGPELRDVAVENVAFVGNADEGLEIDDTDQLAVRNCLFENNAGDGINGDRVTNATITGCTIENNRFEGIDLDSVDSLAIDDCTVRGNGGSGVEFDGDAVDLAVTGTTIADNGVAGLTAPENEIADALIEDCTIANNFLGGIEFEAVDGLTIRDSTIEENFDGVNDPQVTDPAGVRALVRDLTVERSRIENNGESVGAGIRLIGNRVESFDVLNSVIAGNAGFGVAVDGFSTGNGAADVTIRNATITGCTIENNGFEGIGLDSVDSLAIKDCTVRGNGGSGVEFNGDAVNLTVTGTTIADNGVAGLTAPENEIADALIEDCTIANNILGGIEFEAVDGLTIRDSTIEENFDGVNDPQVTDPAGVRALVRDLTIERSRIENNGGEDLGAGIRLIGNRVESFAVLNSVIAGNAGFGIVVNGFFTGNEAADVTIRNVTVRANGNDGLVFRGDANNVTVDRAVVAGNEGSGIRFAFNDLTDVTVVDSNVRNNAELGVERTEFFDSGNVAVQGCFFADNGNEVSDGVDQSGTRTSPVPNAGASI